MTSERRKLAEVVQYFRKQQGWTQAELAERAHLSPAAVRQYEQARRLPDLVKAYYLAEALGLSVDILAKVAAGVVDFNKPSDD
jgi:transcriptional regulator with XRE-family HTH domain